MGENWNLEADFYETRTQLSGPFKPYIRNPKLQSKFGKWKLPKRNLSLSLELFIKLYRACVVVAAVSICNVVTS